MLELLLKKLLEQGQIKKQSAGFVQVEAFLKEALIDLSEADKILGASKRGAYLLAYNAMLKSGRALMLMGGYVPDDGGQHRSVIEVSGFMLGEQFKITIRKFDNMRRKRNELTYEAGVSLSDTDAKNALSEAHSLISGIFKKVKARNPQLELELGE
ncbi:MAG: hypothetical protein Q8N85_06410 [Candidatus Omnitrophota bacterium]|nr:hypothetical protein [Candidatus Omnitrophota bacterium]